MRSNTRLRAGIVFLAAAPLFGQSAKEVTVGWCYSDEGEAVGKTPKTYWTSNDDVLLLDETRPDDSRALESVRATGERGPAFDTAKATASLKSLLPNAPGSLPWPDSFDGAGRRAVYVVADGLFLLDLAEFDAPEDRPSRGQDFGRAPVSGREEGRVCPRQGSLWVYDVASKAETRLTEDGGAAVLNGALSWVYWEEIFNHQEAGYWWSPDSNAIAFLRTDETGIDEVGFQQYATAVPAVVTQRYPKAGNKNPVVRLGISDLATGKTAWMAYRGLRIRARRALVSGSRAVAVQTTDRPQTRLDLWRVDRVSGRAAAVLTDSDDALVDQKELQFARNGDFIVTSERDGHTHLYRYGADGKLRNAVTHGPWSVRGPQGFYGAPLDSAWMDPKNQWVFFTARQKPEGERQLYRVRLDGTGMQRITHEDGTHAITMSPGPALLPRRLLLGQYAAVALAPRRGRQAHRVALRAADGSDRPVPFPEGRDLLGPRGRRVPAAGADRQAARFRRREEVPGDRARLRRPGRADRPRRVGLLVRDTRSSTRLLAARGYVVVSVDPRSATGQSKTLENAVVRKLQTRRRRSRTFAGVRWLKAQPFVGPGALRHLGLERRRHVTRCWR